MAHAALAPSRAPSPRWSAALDAFVVHAFTRLDRVVVDASLVEPRVRAPDHLPRVLDALADMLSGLGAGVVVGAAVRGVRRTFSRPVVLACEQALARAVGSVAPPPRLHAIDDASVRRCADELRSRLRRQLVSTRSGAALLLDALGASVRDVAPAEVPAFARLLHVLAGDDLLGEPFARHLAVGWTAACGLVEARPSACPDAVWRSWVAAVERRRADPELASPPGAVR